MSLLPLIGEMAGLPTPDEDVALVGFLANRQRINLENAVTLGAAVNGPRSINDDAAGREFVRHPQPYQEGARAVQP